MNFDLWDTSELMELSHRLGPHGPLHSSVDACSLCRLAFEVRQEINDRNTCDAEAARRQGFA